MVDITVDPLVRPDDILELDIDKEVEGVNMLLYEPFDL